MNCENCNYGLRDEGAEQTFVSPYVCRHPGSIAYECPVNRPKELNLDAYYYSFTRTDCRPVDKILSAVAYAGSAFHSTEHWNDKSINGVIPSDLIQQKANAAAKIIAEAKALCEKFIDKVESEGARSIETYAECKNLLKAINSEE